MTLLLLQSGPGKAGVAGPGPVNTAVPVISGTVSVGSTLTTTNGTWTGTGISYTYQWKRGGANIGGATSNSYLLVTADIGAIITATVTATNTGGSSSATSDGVMIVYARISSASRVFLSSAIVGDDGSGKTRVVSNIGATT
jgi:hypothetical protein